MNSREQSIDDAHEEGRQDGAALWHDKKMNRSSVERYLNRYVYDWLVQNSKREGMGDAWEAYKGGFREGHKP